MSKCSNIAAQLLFLTSTFMSASALAEERDISQQKDVADFGISRYSIDHKARSVTISLNPRQLLSLNRIIRNKRVSNIALFSTRLPKPNKKRCAFIPLKNEKISIKPGFTTTVEITNINPKDLENTKNSNCTAVDKKALLKAAGLPPQQPQQPSYDYEL